MLYFMRHGESQAQVDGVYADESTSLSETGAIQAVTEGKRLVKEQVIVDRIITSPLHRAQQTAQLVAKELGIADADILIEPRLMEYDLGSAVGKQFDKVPKETRVHQPGAENPEQFLSRISAALDSASALPGNSLLVSHTGVGRMIEAKRLALDPWKFFDLEGLPNARATRLEN